MPARIHCYNFLSCIHRSSSRLEFIGRQQERRYHSSRHLAFEEIRRAGAWDTRRYMATEEGHLEGKEACMLTVRRKRRHMYSRERLPCRVHRHKQRVGHYRRRIIALQQRALHIHKKCKKYVPRPFHICFGRPKWCYLLTLSNIWFRAPY